MNTKKMTLLIIFSLLFSFCSLHEDDKQYYLNLSGNWSVYHLRYDNNILDTTYIKINHRDTNIVFTENNDTISIGLIVEDTINCSDMYGIGISKIFIDDKNNMHSAIPSSDYSGGLLFRR